MRKYHRPDIIKARKNDEAEEFSPDTEICVHCGHVLEDNEDACPCEGDNPELDELYWTSFLGCDEKASQEDIDQAFEDQMT